MKIDPKSIGVGQYQHDLAEIKLSRSLDAVVEDCVNAVGVDVNTASAPLLTRVSGIGEGLAENIVVAPRREWPVPVPPGAEGRGRGWARRRSSSAPGSCAFPAARTRWTRRACTRRRIRSYAASSTRPEPTSRRLIGNGPALRALTADGVR